ncbi:MAG: GAF domain-containing sensor histidine kinase, partial [Cyanobacteria bacterium J06636_27]
GLIEEFSEPFHSEQIELGVKSTYAVPIFVDNQFWGILAFDHCQESKRLTLAEIAVFKTIASCIGSAIYRQQIQQEKEQAEVAILDERNRMAREIHDTLAQAFTGISLQLEAAKNILANQSQAVQERLLRAKNLAKEGITEARRSVRALRPEVLEYSDLVTALRQLVDKMVSGTPVKAQVLIEGKIRGLTSEIEVELFRITQEALTNTLRHARASEIRIQLIYETDTIHLMVKDNGVGFNAQQLHNQGFGLIGMRERCDRLKGNLVINSKIQQGT